MGRNRQRKRRQAHSQGEPKVNMRTEAAVELATVTEDSYVSEGYIYTDGGKEVTKLEPVAVPKYRYGQVLPHEVWAFAECIKDYCRILRADFTDLDHANLMRAILQDLGANPYSIFIGCVDDAGKPQGYMWFRITHDVYRNDPYLEVEHDYVAPEIRDTMAGARIHRMLLSNTLDVMNRCGCKYVKIKVPNRKLFDSRKKLGFEAQSTNMIFRGTAADFRERNPMFKNKGSEVDDNG